MICSPCQSIKTLPDCFANLIIGIVDQAMTDYYIYIKDLTTGRTERLGAISNSGKELKVVNTLAFSESHSYELWVTLKSAANPEDKQQVLIDSQTEKKDCFAVRFESSNNGDDKSSFVTVTMKAI